MSLLLTILAKLLPLYGIVFLGWVAGKYAGVRRESVASLLIYFIAPVVIFYGVATTKLTMATVSLPLLFFCLCSVIGLLFYTIGKRIWTGSEKNILAFTAGTGNTGYFGLPVIVALLGESSIGIAVLVILGFVLYENSLGFFLVAKGQHTGAEALRRLLKLPTLYAVFLGVMIHMIGITLSTTVLETIGAFKGAYIVLGMMMVGIGLSQVTRTSFDKVFSSLAFLAKFIVWPLVVSVIVLINSLYVNVYSEEIVKILLILSVVPLASNTVAFASALNTHPEKAALTVLASTLFAAFYIPFFVYGLFPLLLH